MLQHHMEERIVRKMNKKEVFGLLESSRGAFINDISMLDSPADTIKISIQNLKYLLIAWMFGACVAFSVLLIESFLKRYVYFQFVNL